MLKNIYVRNFVLIDEVNLDLKSGYSVFTGETGAGKSLLIDALSLLCGAKSSSSYIAHGQDKAIIEASLEINNKKTKKLIQEAGYDECDEIVISREITSEGKSTCRFNQRVTTLSFLKTIMDTQIDIHGQRDSEYLLNKHYHLGLLDAYLNDQELNEKVKSKYLKYKKLKDSLDKTLNENYNQDDLEFLKFELKEIDDLAFSEEEIIELEKKQKQMAAFEKVSSLVNDCKKLIEEVKNENLYEVNRQLIHSEDETLINIGEKINESYYQIEEVKSELETYIENMYFDEEEFNDIQTRLYDINKVIKKHGNTYKQFELYYDELLNKISLIENREAFIEKHKKELESAYQDFRKEALVLSKKRKEAAESLKTAICNELVDLSLENAQFDVKFEESDNKDGIDDIEFLISMNVGEQLKPLNKVASGGELSRLMLGLKTIFNTLSKKETIIFDEIDAGVSGKVAFAIGKKMRKISENAQVFSVTHLAPVASFASTHYLVSKKSENNTTITSINQLDQADIINELAMIATGSNSEEALSAAKELYNHSQKKG